MATNPYRPPVLVASDACDSNCERLGSVWIRNAKSLTLCVAAYLALCGWLALYGSANPEFPLTMLFITAAIAAAWANLPLGPRIGWDRSGLPVVFVAYFCALAAYCSTALVAGDIFYSLINP